MGNFIPSTAKHALQALVVDVMHIYSKPTPCSSIPVACHGRAALGGGVGNGKKGRKAEWRRGEGNRGLKEMW